VVWLASGFPDHTTKVWDVIDAKFRPATIDDAALAADLITAAYPALPEDPIITRYRWAHPRDGFAHRRFIAEVEGLPVAFVASNHGPWDQLPDRDSEVEVSLDRARLDGELLRLLWSWIGEQATRDGARILQAYAAEDEPEVLEALRGLGYELDRVERVWELDLRAHGKRLVEDASAARRSMQAEGIDLLTLADWIDPEKFRKVHTLNELTLPDAPHTFPILPMSFDDFMERLNRPDKPHDRYWVARHVDRAVALSYLTYPPVRGTVWTGYTCCVPEYRGRGIAFAVKLQSLAQAVKLGIPAVFTDNDSENAPMLHINEKLGYGSRPGFVSFVKRVQP
jgi:RimJ/RimL family protein N-acetyltransferase